MCSDFQTEIESQVELHSKHLTKFNSATRTYFIKNKLAASLSWSVEAHRPAMQVAPHGEKRGG